MFKSKNNLCCIKHNFFALEILMLFFNVKEDFPMKYIPLLIIHIENLEKSKII